MERPYENYIGVFDSGVGGISVLKECASLLPHEDFLFYGDSAHNPYGDKTPEEVLSLSMAAMEEMIHGGVKALVIACNTATSIAGKELRAKYETETFPVIGIEPAVKPAALDDSGSRILVMATANTLSQDKYYHLIYYVGQGDLYSKYLAKTALVEENLKKWQDEQTDGFDVKEKFSLKFVQA